MKKPKKQKKPSHKSLAFDLAKANNELYLLRGNIMDRNAELGRAEKRISELENELYQARYAREHKTKQLGIYFAALNSLPGDHERLIQLQDELFNWTFETPSTNTL